MRDMFTFNKTLYNRLQNNYTFETVFAKVRESINAT